MSKRAPKPDRGRCVYCLVVTSAPRDPAYEPGTNGAHSRYSHHRRIVLMAGREVLPLCRLTALASGR